ncbi:MAG: class I SAM-dependent methyltransferase [Candidatus Thorarchaeota archaeon]|jgi:tRNA wybutosine-synthesizing protein 2
MQFKKFLHSRLTDSIPNGVPLPSGFRLVGHVVLVDLEDQLWEFAGLVGETILEYDKRFRSVAAKTGPTSGICRRPSYRVIAGEKRTVTCHIENGIRYELDPLRITFSEGNKGERIRLPSKIEPGDLVVDMFACVGQFTIPIAIACDNVRVIAIEIDAEAFHFLTRNVRSNRIGNRVRTILGDCRIAHPKKRANRIVMGYLHNTVDFLPMAMDTISTEGGTVYMHESLPKHMIDSRCNTIDTICESVGFKSDISVRKIKEYAPGVSHFVFDIEIESCS